MRAKMRRQISKLLKELKIPAKLYRGSKLKYCRGEPGWVMRNMIRRLELSLPGTVVYDCDGLNHIVKGFDIIDSSDFRAEYYQRCPKGYLFRFPGLVFEDGGISCGCSGSPEPGRSREYIEISLLRRHKNEDPGWPLSDDQKKIRDILLKGEHVVDERGVMLDPTLSTMYT